MGRLRPRLTLVAAAAAAVLVLGFLLSTCRDPQPRTLPPPSSTSSTDVVPSTTEPDWSRVTLPVIEGATTTTAPGTAGFVTFRGTVQGPDGAAAGAVVVAERLVGDVVQRFEATAAADGTFELTGVPGGRYRVRAYLPPILAMAEPEIFFQRDFETRELRLLLEPFTGVVVRASTTPRAPIAGEGVNLAVLVAERRVGEDGIAREVPVPGVVVRISASGWESLDGTPTASTASNGVAVFQFRCDGVGPVSATATVGAGSSTPTTTAPSPAAPTTTAVGGTFPLDVPPCSPVPTTTTTTSTTTEPDDDDDRSTTTTRG